MGCKRGEWSRDHREVPSLGVEGVSRYFLVSRVEDSPFELDHPVLSRISGKGCSAIWTGLFAEEAAGLGAWNVDPAFPLDRSCPFVCRLSGKKNNL
jgi:hypothetical protein